MKQKSNDNTKCVGRDRNSPFIAGKESRHRSKFN
jgi:hypothetical protein